MATTIDSLTEELRLAVGPEWHIWSACPPFSVSAYLVEDGYSASVLANIKDGGWWWQLHGPLERIAEGTEPDAATAAREAGTALLRTKLRNLAS